MRDGPSPFGHEESFDSEALRRLDAVEFARLYQAFAPGLGLYLARLCGDRELAQDLVQETFVKAYRALPRTSSDWQWRPWLYRIATNTAHSAARRAQWKRLIPFSGQPAESQLAVPASWESRYAEAELVECALAAIKPDYAAPLLLHWREGFSIEECCQILGLSRDNLKKRLYRAKQAFAAAYSQECARAEGGPDR